MLSAHRFTEINVSLIRKMTRMAIEYDAINLAQGFPGFDPPPEVVEAAASAVQDGHNQYSVTWGTPGLRQALAEKYRQFYGMEPDPEDEITVTCGVSEAIMIAMLAIVNPGDQVIVLEPAHENYLPAIVVAGGEAITVPLVEPDFRLDEERLQAAFARHPRAIIVNSPHNPTGRVFSRDELAIIARLCVEYDVIALTDEIYEHILYDGREHVPLATLPGMAERTITTSGLSKTYAATGWRIGWVIAPPSLAEPLRIIHEYLTICAPTPLQQAAEVAVRLPRDFYDGLRKDYTARRDTLVSALEKAGLGVKWPEGSYYVMADFSALRPDLDDVGFADWLVRERRVALVPGRSFYRDAAAARYLVRFAFPKPVSVLKEATRRLEHLTTTPRQS